MKLKYIVDALNRYFLDKYPNANGWFIGKESIEPTRVNLYKKYKVEIFYHTPGKNHLAFTQQLIDRCPEGAEDILKESFTTALLTNLLKNLPELEKYEAIQVSRIQPDDFRGSNDA